MSKKRKADLTNCLPATFSNFPEKFLFFRQRTCEKLKSKFDIDSKEA